MLQLACELSALQRIRSQSSEPPWSVPPRVIQQLSNGIYTVLAEYNQVYPKLGHQIRFLFRSDDTVKTHRSCSHTIIMPSCGYAWGKAVGSIPAHLPNLESRLICLQISLSVFGVVIEDGMLRCGVRIKIHRTPAKENPTRDPTRIQQKHARPDFLFR